MKRGRFNTVLDPVNRLSLINAIARISLAILWFYQGIVPKLIFMHDDELALLRAGGLSHAAARRILPVFGWAEVAVGLALLIGWRWRWPLWLTMIAMPAAILGVVIAAPAFLKAPFNPVSLNLGLIALALIGLITNAASAKSVAAPGTGVELRE